MFVYKHTEQKNKLKNVFFNVLSVNSYFLRKIQNVRENNSRILMIKNAKF